MNEDRTCVNRGTKLTRPRSRKVADHSVDPETWGHTYFVQRGKRIKIGHSGAPHQRLSQLGKPLKVLAIIPNTIIGEGDAHQKFAHLRIEKEWFRAEPELFAFIQEVSAKAIEQQQPRPIIDLSFEDTRRALIAKRVIYGAGTLPGRLISDLIELMMNDRTAEGMQKEIIGKLIASKMDRLKTFQ